MTREATHDPRPPSEPRDSGRRVRRLLHNATWLISGNAFASGLGFIQAVVLGQALGVEGYGLLAVVIALVSTVNQVVDIRMWETVTKFVGDDHERGEHGRARAMVKFAYLVDAGTGILAFALVALLAPFLASRFMHDRAAAAAITLFAGTLLVATVNDTSMALLRVFDRFRWLSIERVASAAVRLAALWVVARSTGRLEPVLIAYVAVEMARGVALLAMGVSAARAALTHPGADHLSVIRDRRAEFWRFTIHNSATALLLLVTRQVDILILSVFHAPREVGLFRMAKNFGQLILRLSDPVYHAIYPELVRLAAAGSAADLRRFIARTMRIVLLVVVPAGLLCILLARPILEHLVGREFTGAERALQIVVAGSLIHAVFLWARPLVLATGRPHLSTLAQAAGVLVLGLGSLLLVPRLGAVGSAITFAATSAVSVGLLVRGAIHGPERENTAAPADGRVGRANSGVLSSTHRESTGPPPED
jgi:O-antigen/teichoic acid export membrane protein